MEVTKEVGALRDTRTYPRVHGRRLRPKDTTSIGGNVCDPKDVVAAAAKEVHMMENAW